MRSSLRSPGDTVVSAISRNATTGFLSLSCSMVIFEAREEERFARRRLLPDERNRPVGQVVVDLHASLGREGLDALERAARRLLQEPRPLRDQGARGRIDGVCRLGRTNFLNSAYFS